MEGKISHNVMVAPVKSQAKGAMGKEQLLECIRYRKISMFAVGNVPTVWKEWTLVQLKEF